MPHIVLTEEQARIVAEATHYVDVQAPDGRPVGSLRILTPEDLEDLERYRRTRHLPKDPAVPSEQVQAFLQKLDELDRTEGVDEAKAQELLRRVLAGEPL
jgi:hypothetical protein